MMEEEPKSRLLFDDLTRRQIAEEFTAALAELGWKSSDFCRKVGVERSTPSRWINQKTEIPGWVPAYLGAMLDIKRLHAKYIEVRLTHE